MAVLVDPTTVVEPAALIRPGARLRGDAVLVKDPLAVFEILGPGPARPDIAGKLFDYARLPALYHLVVMDSVRGAVAHYRREEDDRFSVEILRRGELVLDPPGLGLPLAPLFRN